MQGESLSAQKKKQTAFETYGQSPYNICLRRSQKEKQQQYGLNCRDDKLWESAQNSEQYAKFEQVTLKCWKCQNSLWFWPNDTLYKKYEDKFEPSIKTRWFTLHGTVSKRNQQETIHDILNGVWESGQSWN